MSQLDEDNICLTEKNIELSTKVDQMKKEHSSYKNDAEHMIEDLHAENAKQTEMIVKHSIMMADRQTKTRSKITQTDGLNRAESSRKTLTKKGSTQRLSVSSYYETNPLNTTKN